MLTKSGKNRLDDWSNYWKKTKDLSLLNTASSDGHLIVLNLEGRYNLLAIYRQYQNTNYRIYFIVSFQTLNTVVRFNTIFHDLNSPELIISYDSKNIYQRKYVFGNNVLNNNQVLILYYY